MGITERNLLDRFRQQQVKSTAPSWPEKLTIFVGTMAALTHAGFVSVTNEQVNVGSTVVIACTLIVLAIRFKTFLALPRKLDGWSRFQSARLIIPTVWLLGFIVLGAASFGDAADRLAISFGGWTDILASIIGLLAILAGCRRLATRTNNTAVLLVGSFLVVIGVGTLLLMLPACRTAAADGTSHSADFTVALFTATSASCVTGLIVVPTGSYWSSYGHAVIFSLFQIGGFGILTFGAFVAVLSGRSRGMQFREAGNLSDMLDSDTISDSRRLLLTILIFTFSIEATGAVSLLGLLPDASTGQQIWNAVFLSVSAFCNAGFCLQDDGLLNQGTRWQIFGPVSVLIILGGLGFTVVRDLTAKLRCKLARGDSASFFAHRRPRHRLTVHTKLVLISSLVLTVGGGVAWYMLESLVPDRDSSFGQLLADAWFQTVTFRTAGFNTVDHGAMQPATKLLAIFLMFIGASPGSTGGGIKTIAITLTALNLWSVIRGREAVNVFGRSIPASQVSRALAMIAVGIMIVLVTTGLLAIFERDPDQFLNHLFEATSAFGTVGVSTGITGDLTLPSRLLICCVMFLGRVGPITLLLAMASAPSSGRYEYPTERVSLG